MGHTGITWVRKIGPFTIRGRNAKITSIKIGHFGWSRRSH